MYKLYVDAVYNNRYKYVYIFYYQRQGYIEIVSFIGMWIGLVADNTCKTVVVLNKFL